MKKNIIIFFLATTNIVTVTIFLTLRGQLPDYEFEPRLIYAPATGEKNIIESRPRVEDGDTIRMMVYGHRWKVIKGDTFRAIFTYGFFPDDHRGHQRNSGPLFAISKGNLDLPANPRIGRIRIATDTVETNPGEFTRVPVQMKIDFEDYLGNEVQLEMDTAFYVYDPVTPQ